MKQLAPRCMLKFDILLHMPYIPSHTFNCTPQTGTARQAWVCREDSGLVEWLDKMAFKVPFYTKTDSLA